MSHVKEDEEEQLSQRLQSLDIDRDFVDPGGDFRDKQVAITGSLDSMTRAEAQKLLLNSGAKVTSSVSKNLNFLVSGTQDVRRLSEGSSQSSKHRKVMELRDQGNEIEIIDEEQFLQLLRS
jgi:DNA polymerase-3 subunit epsilon